MVVAVRKQDIVLPPEDEDGEVEHKHEKTRKALTTGGGLDVNSGEF